MPFTDNLATDDEIWEIIKPKRRRLLEVLIKQKRRRLLEVLIPCKKQKLNQDMTISQSEWQIYQSSCRQIGAPTKRYNGNRNEISFSTPDLYFKASDQDMKVVKYLNTIKTPFSYTALNKIVSFKTGKHKRKHADRVQLINNFTTVSSACSFISLTPKCLFWCEFANEKNQIGGHCNVILVNKMTKKVILFEPCQGLKNQYMKWLDISLNTLLYNMSPNLLGLFILKILKGYNLELKVEFGEQYASCQCRNHCQQFVERNK